MKPFNQPDRSRLSPLTNKRLNRNILLTAALFFLTSLFLWSRREPAPVPELPPNKLWLEPDEINKTYSFPTTSDFQPVSLSPGNRSTQELCASFPRHKLSRIQPVLKMGYSENRDKIESQLDSVSACFSADDLLIFSDIEETLRGHKVIDILAYLPDTYRKGSDTSKFQQYLLQKEMKENGTLETDKEAAKKIDGWALDKFKFLPAVERAWAMRPNKEFYVFYETDTYILWDNMFRFLDTLDPDTPLYMGSASPGRRDGRRLQGTLFANGGPGYVLSRGAMKKLLHRRVGPNGAFIDPPFSERFRYLAHDGECCGDSILGFAAWELGIVLQGFYPLFTPYLLTALPFDGDHWCHPLVTMHKVATQDMVKLWRWEFEHRKHGQPLMYADLWHFYRPGQQSTRDNWNNEARGSFVPLGERQADSSQACQKLCRADGECMQWVWKGRDQNSCHLLHAIHYGGPQEAHEVEGKWIDYKSGWETERIDQWRLSRKCDAASWVGPSLKRVF
ncbi:glycosyltransferase family 31 protein [Metarhizium brunneum]